jgi:hypothetical protein
MLSDVIGRFRRIGELVVEPEASEAADRTFAARHTGGGLVPLPPVLFYRGAA